MGAGQADEAILMQATILEEWEASSPLVRVRGGAVSMVAWEGWWGIP